MFLMKKVFFFTSLMLDFVALYLSQRIEILECCIWEKKCFTECNNKTYLA